MKKVQTKNKLKGFFGLFAAFAMAIGVGVSLAPKEVLKTSAATETFTIRLKDKSLANASSYQLNQTTNSYNWGSTTAALVWSSINPGNGQLRVNQKNTELQGTTASYNYSIRNKTALVGNIRSITISAITGTFTATNFFAMTGTAELTSQPKDSSIAGTLGTSSVTWSFAGNSGGYFALGAGAGAGSGAVHATEIIVTYETGPVAQFGVLDSISILSEATRSSFYVDETFSSAGLVLLASDNSSPVVTETVEEGFTTNFDGTKFLESHIGAHTVIVSYEFEGVTKTASYDITVNEAPSYKSYTKITNVNDLHLGANYLFSGLNSGNTYVMSASSGNNRSAVATTLVGGQIVETDDTQRVKLVNGSKENTYGLMAVAMDGTVQGYLAAASSSSNYLHTIESLNDNASWVISFGTDISLVAQGSYSRNTMRFNYNNGSPLFAAYRSGQTAVSMWLDPTSVNFEPSVSITTSPSSIFEGETLQLAASTLNSGGAAVTWSVDNTSIATINATTGLLTSLQTGSVIVTATLVVGETSYTDTVVVTIIESPYDHLGTEADPFSVADALLKATETGSTQTASEFYVKGIISEVTEVDTGSYGNATFKIKDNLSDTASFGAYRVKWGVDGVNFTTETAKNIVEGYEVILLGKMVNYNNNTPQIVQNSKTLGVNKAPAIAEALAFAEEVVTGIGLGAQGECDVVLDLLLDEYDLLSDGAKIEYEASTNETVIAAKNRIAFMEAWVASQSSGGSGRINTPISENNSVTATIIIGFIGLTTLAGYYFLQKKKEA